MKKIAAIIITVAVTIFLSVTALSKPKIILGIIVPGSELRQTEFGAMSGMLNKTGTVSVREIPLQSLKGMEHCDVVWYHRPDTADITVNEINAGEKIKNYVSEGGALILSMDAVKLLNTWGIEPAEIETFSYEAIDDGFGRKIGFHSYRGHPLFDKLYGGAYPWHGKEDNVCRLNGYTEDKIPQARGTAFLAHVASIGPIASEPSATEAIELGHSAHSRILADVLYTAQKERYAETGHLTCVSEAPIDRQPWFTYQGYNIDAEAGPRWPVDSSVTSSKWQTKAFAERFRMVSTKAAYLWLGEHGDDYANKLRELVVGKAATNRHGFQPGVYEASGLPPRIMDVNTNAAVLESVAYALAGRKPLSEIRL